MDFKDFCLNKYKILYDEQLNLINDNNTQRHSISDEEKRRIAQKETILNTFKEASRKYPNIEPTEIWNQIYLAHIHNFSGISNDKTIEAIISASQSWKKTSGHVFEDMIKKISNPLLEAHGLEILLQKDLSLLIKERKVINHSNDIEILSVWLKKSIFDLYIAIKTNNEYKIFGCIQSKTSVRDRTTRDREPSIIAMSHFFWSVIFVLNGEFMNLPKFQEMVNGGGTEFAQNGWHNMYIISNEINVNDRIFNVPISLDIFIEHSIRAAKEFTQERQYINPNWKI